MIEEYEQKAWDLLSEFNRITPPLLMRRFKLEFHFAKKVCERIWLRQHKEARKLASQLDNYGYDPQLQRLAKKNLEKFKGKNRK